MGDVYDIIIIGTGAGGGTLAAELAPFGKRMLLLKRGDWLPRERANWDVGVYRLRERDFGELGHHDGISPAWPI